MAQNNDLSKKNLHVALILDGNRRFAKKLLLKPWQGHAHGANTVEKLLDWLKDTEINQLTLYALSIENLNREKQEVEELFKLMKTQFEKFENDKRIKENKVKIRFIGNLSLLPKDIQDLCIKIEDNTKENNNYVINFCIAYGGRQELTQAINKILKSGRKEVLESDISKHLWLEHEPDFVIRTGGVIRSSNFLPWQTTYSEWFFLDKLWPEFEKKDLINCVNEFKLRKRNFGK